MGWCLNNHIYEYSAEYLLEYSGNLLLPLTFASIFTKKSELTSKLMLSAVPGRPTTLTPPAPPVPLISPVEIIPWAKIVYEGGSKIPRNLGGRLSLVIAALLALIGLYLFGALPVKDLALVLPQTDDLYLTLIVFSFSTVRRFSSTATSRFPDEGKDKEVGEPKEEEYDSDETVRPKKFFPMGSHSKEDEEIFNDLFFAADYRKPREPQKEDEPEGESSFEVKGGKSFEPKDVGSSSKSLNKNSENHSEPDSAFSSTEESSQDSDG